MYMKNIYIALLSALIFWMVTVPTLAVTDITTTLDSFSNVNEDNRVTLKSIDEYGNENILIDVPSESLQPLVNFYSNTPALPHPAKYASADSGIQGFSGSMAAQPFPNNSNFLLIDMGPNWSVEDSDKNFQSAHGRYVYIFYGQYVEELGTVVTGHGGPINNDGFSPSESHYTSIEEFGDPDTYTLTIRAPYVCLNYNEETGKMTILENTYDNFMTGAQWTLSMTGITIDGDPYSPDYYARILTWSHCDNNTGFVFSSDLVLTRYYTDMNWLSVDGSPTVSGEDPSDLNLWLDGIVNGGIIDPDSSIGQFILNALKNIGGIIEFIAELPSYLNIVLGILPEPFAEFLKACIGLLITAFAIKIGLQIIK